MLIVTAGNEGSDISQSALKSNEYLEQSLEPGLSYWEKQAYVTWYADKRRATYFQQFSDHPILKERVRIAVNACVIGSLDF